MDTVSAEVDTRDYVQSVELVCVSTAWGGASKPGRLQSVQDLDGSRSRMAWEQPSPGLEHLLLDEALVHVVSSTPAWLYSLSANCVACPWQRMEQKVEGNTTYTLHTHHSVRLLVSSQGEEEYLVTGGEQEAAALCSLQPTHLGQFGAYQLKVEDCKLETLVEPVNGNLALLVWFLALLGSALVWWGLARLPGRPLTKLAKLLGWSKEEESGKGAGGKVRLRSLDTFRGIAIALMIFVNDGGGGYWFMEHATWNGLYVADLVFPWFLWIMGVCIPMSVSSALKRETPTKSVIWGVTLRSCKLFLLGFILNSLGWIQFSKLRVPGVLQRFAICYFVVSLVGFCFTRSTKQSRGGWARDLLQLWPQWVVMLLLLTLHQLLVYLVPVPGCKVNYGSF